MNQKSLYRLQHYRIIEYENGLLWWETHYDFGKQRSGECFIHENILVLGEWKEEKDGSLIGEFLDPLKKLPPWDRTRYYCQTSDLLDIHTGRRLSDTVWKLQADHAGFSSKGITDLEAFHPGLFHLGRYRISIDQDRSISWQTPGGRNRIIGGSGFIESNILILGPEAGKELKQDKQEFLENLSNLPHWNNSRAWCRLSVLRSCQERQQTRILGKISVQPRESKTSMDQFPVGNPRIVNPAQKGQSSEKLQFPESGSSQPFPSMIPHVKTERRLERIWPFSLGRKFLFTGLILVFISGLTLGLILAFHSLEKKFHWPKWFKENRHEHRSEHHSRSNPKIFTLLFYFILSFSLSLAPTAQAEEKDIVLEESGIHYPGGFDPNTVGEIQGKAFHFSKPERGPIRFHLSSDRGTYIVLTAPHWYWHKIQVKIAEGTAVFVVGSKSYGLDGHLYIIAREVQIVSSGRSYLFRGKDGIPLWKGSGGSNLRMEKGGNSYNEGRKGVEFGGSHHSR